jgi:hypothetical protein
MHVQLCHSNKNIPTNLFEIIHSSAQIKHTLHIQSGVRYAQITKHQSFAPTNIAQKPHTNHPYQQTSNMQDLKHMLKSLFEQMGTMLNLLMLTKLQ